MHKMCKECANYDHKNLKHTKACRNCVTKHYAYGTESCPSSWRALPQTNADRIRAMSDEELAVWIRIGISSDACDYCEYNNGYCDGLPCIEKAEVETIVEWLKQPAEE